MAKVNNNFEKRKRITKNEVLELLKDCYKDIFKAYYVGLANYNEEVNMTIPEARTRLVGPLLNAKITESFILAFPENWSKGKYGRIIFRWNGVLMLIKKLDKNDKPSYIPTILSDSIVNQYQQSLFPGDEGKPLVDGVKLSCVQFFVMAALSAVLMLVMETPDWAGLLACIGPVLYVGIFSSGVGYTLQILAQKDSDPTVVSLLLSLESVFATVAGALILGDRMSGKEYLGCVLMLCAVVLAQLPDFRRKRERTET